MEPQKFASRDCRVQASVLTSSGVEPLHPQCHEHADNCLLSRSSNQRGLAPSEMPNRSIQRTDCVQEAVVHFLSSVQLTSVDHALPEQAAHLVIIAKAVQVSLHPCNLRMSSQISCLLWRSNASAKRGLDLKHFWEPPMQLHSNALS
eukprot:1172498-Amphidinium_carterae.1